MINHRWQVNTGNKTHVIGTIPKYVNDSTVGEFLTGIPYKWGGSDGLTNNNIESRNTFTHYQSQGRQAGDVMTSGNGKSEPTGVDCSGFAQLTWNRGNESKRNVEGIHNNLTRAINRSDLRLMDALTRFGPNVFNHVALFVARSGDGVLTREATIDSGQKAQSLIRDGEWFMRFTPRRYIRIMEDEFQPETSVTPI